MQNPTSCVVSDAGAGVRFAAALHLYSRLARAQPGSDFYERADLALSLILSPRRTADTAPFLARNAWRNARTLLVRERRRTTTDPLTHDTSVGRLAAQGEIRSCMTSVTPLDLALANDLEARIRAEVISQSGRNGGAVIDGMLSGESVVQTAERLSVSVRTVERLRSVVRRVTREVSEAEA